MLTESQFEQMLSVLKEISEGTYAVARAIEAMPDLSDSIDMAARDTIGAGNENTSDLIKAALQIAQSVDEHVA